MSSFGRYVGENDLYPRLDDETYGKRPIRFLDTGEWAEIVTIDGEPAAMEPSSGVIEVWLESKRLNVVTDEALRDLRLRASDGDAWRKFLRKGRLRRLSAAVRARY